MKCTETETENEWHDERTTEQPKNMYLPRRVLLFSLSLLLSLFFCLLKKKHTHFTRSCCCNEKKTKKKWCGLQKAKFRMTNEKQMREERLEMHSMCLIMLGIAITHHSKKRTNRLLFIKTISDEHNVRWQRMCSCSTVTKKSTDLKKRSFETHTQIQIHHHNHTSI